MLRRIITEEIAVFMVWVIELAAIEFYGNDRALAFKDFNDSKLWHHFIEKYEEKRCVKAEAVIDEIGERLGREKPPLSNLRLLSEADTDFITAIVRGIAKKYNWNYSVSLERFYASRVCRILSEAKISFSSFSEGEMLELFDADLDPSWQVG